MGLIRAGEHAQDMTVPEDGPRYIAHQPSAALAATRAQVGTGSPQAQSQEQPRPARIRRPPPPPAAMQVGRCPCPQTQPRETEKCSVWLLISLRRTTMTSQNLHQTKHTGSGWKILYPAAGAHEENQSRYGHLNISLYAHETGVQSGDRLCGVRPACSGPSWKSLK